MTPGGGRGCLGEGGHPPHLSRAPPARYDFHLKKQHVSSNFHWCHSVSTTFKNSLTGTKAVSGNKSCWIAWLPAPPPPPPPPPLQCESKNRTLYGSVPHLSTKRLTFHPTTFAPHHCSSVLMGSKFFFTPS